MASTSTVEYGAMNPIPRMIDTLSICTQIKDSTTTTYDGLFESLSMSDVIPSISPLLFERQCPSPPRPTRTAMFCWSHITPSH